MIKGKKKTEALIRMKILSLDPKAIELFADDGELVLSFRGELSGINKKQTEIVHKFESEHDCLVYHVIHDYTTIGEMLTFLYVSAYPEEWEQDRIDLRDGFPLAYVVNLNDDAFSEFGSVGVKPYRGAVIRTA